MSRNLFGVEDGVLITNANEDTGVSQLKGSGAPGGDAGFQDAALQGSTYQRTNGEKYLKTLAGTGTDKWRRLATTDDTNALSFRKELVRVSTGEALSAGARDLVVSPFTDDDGAKIVAGDFTVGEYILSGIGGVPKLFEVTVVSGDSITLVEETENPLAANDNFVSQNHLPDTPNDQEVEALLHYNGSAVIKIGDTNWEFATGINLSSGYTEQNGSLSSSDTVEAAIEKLDGNQLDLQTLSGESQGSVDHDTFTGNIIQDSRTTHQALQDLESAIEDGGRTQNAGVTTQITQDSVVVDDILGVEWELHMREDANPARVKMEKITALHDGESGGDASNTDVTVHTKLKLGAAFNATVSVDLSGSGGAQVMRLRVASSSGGVTFTARRTDIKAP